MKQKCRLSLNLAREGEQRLSNYGIHSSAGGINGGSSLMATGGYPATSETLHIRSQRDSNNRGRLEQMEVTLSRYNHLKQKKKILNTIMRQELYVYVLYILVNYTWHQK